jgi:N-acetylmuramoyl-L-alanine amidase
MHPIDVAKNLEPLLAPPAPPPNRVVVLDPGHGGVNAGTRAITGNRFEKEFTLDWARRLRPLLEARGWTVHLTRTNDVDVPLAARVAEADARGAAVFVSLHFNSAFPDPRAAGVETYCLTPQGLPSSITRNFPDDVASFHPNNAHDAGNLRLAVRVQRAMSAVTGAADRGVRRARFMEVLRRQDRPAILAEGGFLSNPDEARRIAQPEYRQRLALAVAAALGDSPP